MNIRATISALLLTVAPCSVRAQATACSDSVILSDRVGVVRIGMRVDSLRRRCRVLRDTLEMNEGEEQRVIYALVSGDTLRVEVEKDAVWRLSVRRPGFATRDSIHVGMPLSRFLVGRRPTIGVGEGKVYVFDTRHRGNSFGLSGEAYARVPKPTAAGLARLPRSTIIDEILVTGIPRPETSNYVERYSGDFVYSWEGGGFFIPCDGGPNQPKDGLGKRFFGQLRADSIHWPAGVAPDRSQEGIVTFVSLRTPRLVRNEHDTLDGPFGAQVDSARPKKSDDCRAATLPARF